MTANGVKFSLAMVVMCAGVICGCERHASFMALQEIPLVAVPTRHFDSPQRVVGVLRKGQLVTNARVVAGVDYKYYEIVMEDGGVGYALARGSQFHVYLDK